MVIQLILALSASFVMALVAFASLREYPDDIGSSGNLPDSLTAIEVQDRAAESAVTANLAVDSLRHYSDSLYGFDVAIPSGWHRIVTVEESEADSKALNWRYAVGFESPRNHPTDRYADYVMIEVLPGTESGAFESNGKEREATLIDGRPAVRDRVWLDSVDLQDEALALVVYQATFSGLGYQVGLYAIGEQHEAAGLQLAFDAMLHTFTLREEPYSVY